MRLEVPLAVGEYSFGPTSLAWASYEADGTTYYARPHQWPWCRHQLPAEAADNEEVIAPIMAATVNYVKLLAKQLAPKGSR